MAVKIRLMRVGKKKQPSYRVVVTDARSPRDGRFIEVLGQYAPRAEPSVVTIDSDRALHWLQRRRPADRAGRQAARDRRRVGRVQGRGRQGRRRQAEGEDAEGRRRSKPAPEAPRRAAAPAAEAAAEEAAADEAPAEDAPAAEEASE